jgi:hypothetical protein
MTARAPFQDSRLTQGSSAYQAGDAVRELGKIKSSAFDVVEHPYH